MAVAKILSPASVSPSGALDNSHLSGSDSNSALDLDVDGASSVSTRIGSVFLRTSVPSAELADSDENEGGCVTDCDEESDED